MLNEGTARRRLGQLLVCVLAAMVASAARAELTVEKLAGVAVTGVGPYYQDLADAIRDFGSKNYGSAFDHLDKAKKSTPRLAPAEVMMAQLYADAGVPAGTVAMLEKAIQRSPQDPEAYVILAERAVGEGRLTEAETLFQRAAKLAESFTENPRRKQDLQMRSLTGGAGVDELHGNLKDAKSKLELLIKLDQRVASSHERLGRVLFSLGEQKAAYSEFQLAAEADKQAVPAELAMAYLVTDKAAAENWLNFALKKSGQDLRTQTGAAAFLIKKNQPDAAKEHADEAVKLDPDGFESNSAAGLVARMLGDYKAAQEYLGKAHLAMPTQGVIVNHLALALIELPDDTSRQRALQFAELSLKLNGNTVESLSTLGWINYRLNRRRDAEQAFAAAMNMPEIAINKTMNSEMAYYLATLAKEQGNFPEAIKMLKEALNTDQPFAYRKPAEELLAQLARLDKSAKSKGDKAPPASKSAEGSGKTGAAK
jgi:tetratricopeptide (TPR) repeat protein